MSGAGATPVFIDTGAFYARADEDDKHHEDAIHLFSGIRSGDIAYLNGLSAVSRRVMPSSESKLSSNEYRYSIPSRCM